MIDAVIFDKDGTLFDFRTSWGGFAARLLHDLAETPAQARALGDAVGFDLARGDFATDSPMIAATTEQIAARMLPLLPGASLGALTERLNALSLVAQMYPAVPLRPVLGDLRGRGLRIGLATNDTEAAARAHLSEAEIAPLFDFVAGCDSGHGAKPEPGMLLAFAQSFALDPARVVMVGDSLHDLMAGRRAGMRAVGVLTGIATAEELGPHADAVLPDIASLAAWIDAQPVR